MTPHATHVPFSTANPHALATILEAAQTRSIIASRDIFDIAGIKLWARDQPVSAALQRKLLDRRLRNPLESCLLAEDGVTSKTLIEAAHALVGQDTPLRPLLLPHAARIVREAAHLPLHPVAQLLLTAGQVSRPESFQHAVQAMALCGALSDAQGGRSGDVRIAMLAGLLHDLGEMYIDPAHGEADAERGLDFVSYQQLVVHPHVGQLLLRQLTNYPPTMARAVAEHHERLDGSGYPQALQRDALSPLGRLLAVVEATLGVLRGRPCGLPSASVALRVVPGEFDLEWAGRIATAAAGQPQPQPQHTLADVQHRVARLDAALLGAQACAGALAAQGGSIRLQQALDLSRHLLGRLRLGWFASGLWTPQALTEQDSAEVEAVEHELGFRLRAIERAARLRAGDLPADEVERLQSLCAQLRLAAAPD
jgi:hypothetical protein